MTMDVDSQPAVAQDEWLEDKAQDDEGVQQEEEQVYYIGSLHQRKPGDRTHFCISCSFPVAVFGRIYPCLHAYCLACASDMSSCFM